MSDTRPTSVVIGKDNETLLRLFQVHSPCDKPRILDVTYNKGVMWRGTEMMPHRMDIDGSLPELDTVGDFNAMPFDDHSFDVIVFDPPHLPTHAASENSSGIWKERYGITSSGDGREGDNVNGMFPGFLKEAKRVLVQGGVVFAKIADLTHNHRYQWQHVDFINEVSKCGMTPCDMIIKCDPCAGHLMSSKWSNVKHFRKAHCYWIVVRNSLRCEG